MDTEDTAVCVVAYVVGLTPVAGRSCELGSASVTRFSLKAVLTHAVRDGASLRHGAVTCTRSHVTGHSTLEKQSICQRHWHFGFFSFHNSVGLPSGI